MKIAVIGTGSIGQRHLSNLRRLGIDDLIAVSEHHRHDRVEIDGTEVVVCHDFETALAERLDAVVIANPTSLHLDYLRRAVDAGCHIFLEKPAAITADGLLAVEKAAADRGLVIAMGTMYRFNERLESLRARVLAGEIGRVLCAESVIGEHIADYHPDEDYRLSYTARADLGGGVLLTQIHQIDWLHWTFGPFASVFASGGHLSALDIDVEDSATYMLRGLDGTPAYGHLDYLQRPKRAGLSVTGTDGRLDWNLFDHTLTLQPAANDAEPEIVQGPYDRNAMFIASMLDFLECIKSGARPRSTLTDGRETLEIVDAIKASIKSGMSESIAP